MAVKIEKLNDALDENGVKMLIYGNAGAGKTVFCASAEQKTLLISAESGLRSIKGAVRKGLLDKSVFDYVQVAKVSSIEELEEVYEDIKYKNDFDVVALDSISEIAEVCLSQEKLKNNDARAAYGNTQDRINEKIRDFRDLPQYHIIMACKEARFVDQSTGVCSYEPAMPGSRLGQDLPHLFDEVFRISVETDQNTGDKFRIIRTEQTDTCKAKDRSGVLDPIEYEISAKYFIDKMIEEGEIKKSSIAESDMFFKHLEKRCLLECRSWRRYNCIGR